MKKFTIICLLLSSLSTSRAGVQRADSKESLRGLGGVYIITQIIDAQPEGLTTNRIESIVKSILHDGGIAVDPEPLKAHGEANLSIALNTTKSTQLGLYLFTVDVAVTEDVKLARRPSASRIHAETWRRSIQGLTTPDRTDVIEQALKQCLQHFVASYQAVNPVGASPAH